MTNHPNTSAFERLRERAPFSWLRERDIDLLLCAELHANAGLQRLLESRVGDRGKLFAGAWISVADSDGETDLIVAFETGQGPRIALIENKIAANFQPEQGERYQKRAARWRSIDVVSAVATVLIAPSEYMDRAGAAIFDTRLTYEEIAAELRRERDPRSLFLANALEAGIAAYRRGYVPQPDTTVSNIWATCWEISRQVAPLLEFQRPSMKPSQSTWIYFTDAKGFSKEDVRRPVIVFKAERGQVDLQFASTSVGELETLLSGIIESDMKIKKAGKSASIRLHVPKVDFSGGTVEQEVAIREGILSCERLRKFFTESGISQRIREV